MSKAKAPTSKTNNRTAPKLERDGENGIAFRFKDAEQIQRLYGLKTEEAARLLMEIGLKAFGQSGLDYLELVPALAVEMHGCRYGHRHSGQYGRGDRALFL